MKIFMMGDSTMSFYHYYQYPLTGWGVVLPLFTDRAYTVVDKAVSGSSSKSFIDNGVFVEILNEMEQGDFAICEFGHNDEKEYDPQRYTEPYGTFTDNMRFFADEVKAKGGHIVFATPISRHLFESGEFKASHGDYPAALKKFCAENGYTCIDMEEITRELYIRLGEERSAKFHMILKPGEYCCYPDGRNDHTHLTHDGALVIAELFVRAVQQTDDPIKNVFIDLENVPLPEDRMKM